ncbi:MAG: DsrE family protein [Candidatus Acidiferrales bacterium]
MKMPLKKLWIGAAAAFVLIFGVSGLGHAQSGEALPIAGVEAATDLPGEHQVPDPNMVYKVAFDIGKEAPKMDEVHPALLKISEFYNTLAKHGVPAENRKVVVVFHQKGTEYALSNAAYKARHDGHDNPNIALIRTMKKAGVDFRVCGQGVLGSKIDTATILPEVHVDLWALTTIVTLEMQGYAHVAM